MTKGKLAAFLEEDTEDTVASLDAVVAAKIRAMDASAFSRFVAEISANPKLSDHFASSLAAVQAVHIGQEDMQVDDELLTAPTESTAKRGKLSQGFHGRKWTELARFVPLRLTGEERKILALIERTMRISEYTDNVDLYIARSARNQTIEDELGKIRSVLSGQYIAMKMSKSTEPLTDDWFQAAFEVARRYKAMNPDRLRDSYVKLMYMLMDARSSGKFCEWPQRPMRTVAIALDEAEIDKSDFLSDPLIDEFIHGNSRQALNFLADKYVKPPKSRDQIELIAESLKDYALLVNSFLDPISDLLEYLQQFFDPKHEPSREGSLAIRAGENGARLSHSHSRQFFYVTQSLRLWREVLKYLMPIWLKAEDDLLSGGYRLADTGQGLNRVQGAPNCSRFMHTILSKVQGDLDGSWIGSSVVHMGDHTVPNALMFLDKYCQIPRILGPIAHTLKQLDKEYANAPRVVQEYIDATFGGVEEAKKLICCDFFKHAFDGSGADNAYDAGSCIDGRLTSSWNWCSKIEKKKYFPLFLLTNFVGFDGQHGW